jgi:hypothetical protein
MTDDRPVKSLSIEYHTAIGIITVNGALMDQLIDSAIWVVLKMSPELGVTITKLIANTSRKILFLRELVDPMFVDDNIRRDFHDVFCKLRSAQANRSKIVHAKWVFTPADEAFHIEVAVSDETLPVVEPMPLSRLQHYGSEIWTAHMALENFFLQVDLKPDTTGTYAWPPRFESRQFRRK